MTAAGNGENSQQDGEHCDEQSPKSPSDVTNATANDSDNADGNLPIEMQLYEVEVTEDMDPLEYAFR